MLIDNNSIIAKIAKKNAILYPNKISHDVDGS